jgi:hypothetical protein
MADNIASNANVATGRAPTPPGELEEILICVAQTLRGSELARAGWVGTVLYKLNDMEIWTVRGFVDAALTVNCRLQVRGFKQLHFMTLKLLLRAACDVIFEEGGRAEALTDRDDEDLVPPMGFERREEDAAAAGIMETPEEDELPMGGGN